METYLEKRQHPREPHEQDFEFLVLYMEISDLKRDRAGGKIVDVSQSGLGIITHYPLEPGYILEWDDAHKKDKLHIALVKWSRRMDSMYRVGLKFV